MMHTTGKKDALLTHRGDHQLRGVVARRTDHRTRGVAARAAKKQPTHRRFGGEPLGETKFIVHVEDVASASSEVTIVFQRVLSHSILTHSLLVPGLTTPNVGAQL